MAPRLNQQTLKSLARDVRQAIDSNGGDLPKNHPLLAEVHELSSPDFAALQWYFLGAHDQKRAGDMYGAELESAIRRHFGDTPQICEPPRLPVAPTIPDAEYFAYGVGTHPISGLREIAIVAAAAILGLALVVAAAFHWVVKA